MTNTLLKTGLGIALATLISFNAYADDMSSSDNGQSSTMSNSTMGSGRMSAGGGVQPAPDQYSDGNCKGVDCPDEGLEEDNVATDIPDDNTDASPNGY